jgi:hypothetical protein
MGTLARLFGFGPDNDSVLLVRVELLRFNERLLDSNGDVREISRLPSPGTPGRGAGGEGTTRVRW